VTDRKNNNTGSRHRCRKNIPMLAGVEGTGKENNIATGRLFKGGRTGESGLVGDVAERGPAETYRSPKTPERTSEACFGLRECGFPNPVRSLK